MVITFIVSIYGNSYLKSRNMSNDLVILLYLINFFNGGKIYHLIDMLVFHWNETI